MIKILNDEQIEYCKELYREWIDNKTVIAQKIIDKFWLAHNKEVLRKTVRRIVVRMEEDDHRGNAMNKYAEQEKTGHAVIRGWRHKTELEDGSKVSIRLVPNDIAEELAHLKDDIVWTVSRLISEAKIDKVFLPKIKKGEQALKVTISDTHVWLNPNPDWKGLFQYEYNTQLFMDWIEQVYNSVYKEYQTHWAFDLVLIQDLWDGLDWRNGFTTRGWHQLDQNMDNMSAFETYVMGKVRLIESIFKAGITDKIIVRDVCQDNHSGDFWLIANFTIQKIIDRTFGEWKIEFQRITRFMEHFTYGDHCFILTHGKDEKHMKSWLPFRLTEKAINFITDYIEHYGINSKYIHIEKGDLHQIWYERKKRFDYRNHMSFAPGSAWVAHNFGDTYSGYSIDIIPKYSSSIAHTDYFIDYKKI